LVVVVNGHVCSGVIMYILPWATDAADIIRAAWCVLEMRVVHAEVSPNACVRWVRRVGGARVQWTGSENRESKAAMHTDCSSDSMSSIGVGELGCDGGPSPV
jgi:hypothetical protein